MKWTYLNSPYRYNSSKPLIEHSSIRAIGKGTHCLSVCIYTYDILDSRDEILLIDVLSLVLYHLLYIFIDYTLS